MSDVGKAERETQKRVIALFRDELGYRYLGNWSDRDCIRSRPLFVDIHDPGGAV